MNFRNGLKMPLKKGLCKSRKFSVIMQVTSELIRESISEYLKKLKQPSALEIGKDVFGKYSSGFEYLSSNRKKLVISKIETKRQ